MSLREEPTFLPIIPGALVSGIDLKSCHYYNSLTLPLKIKFTGPEILYGVLYKAGDDLRQDWLVMQLISLMDSVWITEGLDLKMVSFATLPTGDRKV